MTNLLCKGIEYYCERNKKSPSEVIIFHNACTGDQNKLFYEYFIEPSLKRLKEESKTSHPPCLTMVMVNTKTNERFFSQGHNNEVRNVGAGTLVSTDIVSPEYDFYMVSQFSNKGSTVPNHYKIIYSDSKIEEGLIQEVVFSQCFNYVNWTGSIKVPGILQYAKKACKFNSEVLEGEDVEKELCTKLYFV